MALSPYETATALGRPTPPHVTDLEDQARIRAYGTYEDIWNNVPEAFQALLREDQDPLSRRYVPVAREIIEAVNRYLGQDMETVWTSLPGFTVTDEQMEEWKARLASFWAREEVDIKFLSNKRWSLIKGDGLLHVTADITKLEGQRVRLTEVQPEEFFPIWDPADGERMLGCYLASVVLDDEEEEIVQRIEYHRIMTQEDAAEFAAPLGSIFYRLGFFQTDKWDARDPEIEEAKVPPPSWAAVAEGALDPIAGFALDPRITSIPVYHIRNRRRGGKPGRFGTSEIQGLESVFAGIIQNASDEDLTVAMDGIGVYWTTSGKARDSENNEIPWTVGPASIAELEADGAFGRVPGVNSVDPYQDHIGFLKDVARGANAAPAIASGTVDTSVTLSGVAMRIQFMPTLAANAEREAEMSSKWTHLLYDLMTMWFLVYEGWTPLPLQPSVIFGDPLPPDRTAILTEVTTLVTAGIASKEWAISYLNERLGYGFPAGMQAVAEAEQQAALDSEAAQIAANAGQTPGGELG